MIKREAIAVYSPTDPWESALQDAAKLMTGNWLDSHSCQQLSWAVASLKIGTDWLDREDLMLTRASYLFSPQLNQNKQNRVFVTQLLFLRDILENREINRTLHEPICFITEPLAYFLFRNCLVHIHVHEDLLRSANPKADFLDVGGFLIAQQGDLVIKDDVIFDIKYFGHDKTKATSVIEEVQLDSGLQFLKAASKEIDFDIFAIEEHYKDIRPGMYVWDKEQRNKAKIVEVEPGETGIVRLEYLNGNEGSIEKDEFDKRFIII